MRALTKHQIGLITIFDNTTAVLLRSRPGDGGGGGGGGGSRSIIYVSEPHSWGKSPTNLGTQTK